jgi:uncharacterized membrane protein YhaH (DUF805 family)
MSLNKILFSFNGRIGRKTFWLFVVPVVLVSLAVNYLSLWLLKNEFFWPASILLIAWLVSLCWVMLAIQVKRWHDLDRSGWMVLINAIPYLGILAALGFLGFFKGSVGNNRFGASNNL